MYDLGQKEYICLNVFFNFLGMIKTIIYTLSNIIYTG